MPTIINATFRILIDGKELQIDNRSIPDNTIVRSIVDHLDLNGLRAHHHVEIRIEFDPPMRVTAE